MCGENHPNTLQTEAHRTRTSVIFSQQQQTHDTATQMLTQEQQTTQTAALSTTAPVQTAQERTARSGCARRSAEKTFMKNQSRAAKRSRQYQNSEQPAFLLEQYLASEEKELGEVTLEQEGDAELQSLKKNGLTLEYQAMEKIKDHAAAREFFQKLRYFQDCTELTQKSILRASVRRNILLPRLQAEGKLNQEEIAAICSQHQKALGSLTTLSSFLDDLRSTLNALLPAGEQVEDVSDDDLAQYESQIHARAMKPAKRPTESQPDVPRIGLQKARAQIFAERNTALPKTLVNYDLRRKGFEQPNAGITTSSSTAASLATEFGLYSQAEYNLFRHKDRQEMLEAIIDRNIKNLVISIKAAQNPIRKQRLSERREMLIQNRNKIAGMSASEAEELITSYLSELSVNCAWSRRLPARVVEQILDSEDHRIKTQFETNRSEAALDFSSREQMAKHDFGTDISSLEIHEHENYGYLSDKNLERELASNSLDSYGSVMISFKKEVLADRTTLALGDTLATISSGAIPCRAAHPDVSVVDRFHYPLILSAALTYQDRKQDGAQDADIFRELTMMGIEGLSYGELQFHGDLKIDNQYVDQVLIIRRSYPEDAEKQQEENNRVENITAKLKAAGITNVEIRDKKVSGRAADV